MTEQLSLFAVVGDTDRVSPTTLGDTKNIPLQRFIDRATIDPSCTIETYHPNGRKTEYYRLKFRLGKQVKTKHIPGGSVRAELAQLRVKKLQAMINRGAELTEILAAVKDFNH